MLRFSYLHRFSGPLGQKWRFWGVKWGKAWGDIDPQRTLLTFGGLHLCVKFGENGQRNATVRVTTHGQTDTHTQTDRQTQTDFIICLMLYAIAMGQIIIDFQYGVLPPSWIFICPIAIAYSMGQIIKSVCVCLSVCLCVSVCPCVVTLTVAFLYRFLPNLTQRCKEEDISHQPQLVSEN